MVRLFKGQEDGGTEQSGDALKTGNKTDYLTEEGKTYYFPNIRNITQLLCISMLNIQIYQNFTI